MKVNRKKILKKGRGNLFIQMVTYILANSKMMKCQGKGNTPLKMEIFMKEI